MHPPAACTTPAGPCVCARGCRVRAWATHACPSLCPGAPASRASPGAAPAPSAPPPTRRAAAGAGASRTRGGRPLSPGRASEHVQSPPPPAARAARPAPARAARSARTPAAPGAWRRRPLPPGRVSLLAGAPGSGRCGAAGSAPGSGRVAAGAGAPAGRDRGVSAVSGAPRRTPSGTPARGAGGLLPRRSRTSLCSRGRSAAGLHLRGLGAAGGGAPLGRGGWPGRCGWVRARGQRWRGPGASGGRCTCSSRASRPGRCGCARGGSGGGGPGGVARGAQGSFGRAVPTLRNSRRPSVSAEGAVDPARRGTSSGFGARAASLRRRVPEQLPLAPLLREASGQPRLALSLRELERRQRQGGTYVFMYFVGKITQSELCISLGGDGDRTRGCSLRFSCLSGASGWPCGGLFSEHPHRWAVAAGSPQGDKGAEGRLSLLESGEAGH